MIGVPIHLISQGLLGLSRSGALRIVADPGYRGLQGRADGKNCYASIVYSHHTLLHGRPA